ncbi:hypothetical protein [Ulvibacter litoralis]|uniref:Uncharacterized protein n=1 Tax=Ulvibacter litoralis TaxID=227084 RepID=A0A1G7D1U0_9FLAO|nr:hypothetical protein [Ulvibacter litoralis]GHC45186.1 hypothetical protein GCM10008083_04880 [Ulvibacter litoralis]SDE45489.1 hypothetical protein SAMN05421855_101713 [Ulvibacter litoralis]
MENVKVSSKNLPTLNVQTEYITLWNTIRKEEEEVQSIFNLQGNMFHFIKPTADIKSFHIYVACDASRNLHFYFISSSDDANKKFNWVYSSQIKQLKYSLPQSTQPPTETKFIDWSSANKWVNNWIDDSKRNAWISDNFSVDSDKNNIVQAFEINANDFEINDIHNCFLALKKDGSGNYQADLVVYNTATQTLVNTVSKVLNGGVKPAFSFEDLARPVPPFGGDGLEYKNFGVLVDLGIV